MAPAPKPLFHTVSTPRWAAEIDIFASRRAAAPVSRRLYGKFCEHLGANIYNGMWAQIVRNPGFEPWRFYGPEAHHGHRVAHLERRLGVRGLGQGRARGIAFAWIPCGQGDATFALDEAEPFNSTTSQKIAVTRVPSGGASGIAQPIALPVHRVADYELSLAIRGTKGTGELRVAIRKGAPGGRLLIEKVIRSVPANWAKRRLKLSVPKGTLERAEIAYLSFTLARPGTVWLDNVELFPADHVDGFDPDVIRLWREARLPLLRYPGGNFVSGYHWRDGIGPRDQRETTFNRPWNQPEPNHVGTDEFIAFCRAVGCEPFICLNAGDGTPEEAAAWVEYCNGAPDTANGRLRARNGHREPHNIRLWEVGNELYGGWQIGHCTPEEYAERYERFYRAMKAVDPTIHIIANGQDLRWNRPLVTRKGAIVESVTTHTLIGGGLRDSRDPVATFESLMAYPTAYEGILDAQRRQMKPHVARPRIAITELQLFTNRSHLPSNQEIAEALFLAGTLHTAIRMGDLVELVTHSATLNHGGGLLKQREVVFPHPVYFTSKLYATQPGSVPVGIRVATPTVDVPARGGLPAVKGSPYIDAVALLSEAGDRLVVLAVNRHHERAIPATIRLGGFAPAAKMEVQTIQGATYRDRNTLAEPDRVGLRESTQAIEGSPVQFTFGPCSVTALTFQRTP